MQTSVALVQADKHKHKLSLVGFNSLADPVGCIISRKRVISIDYMWCDPLTYILKHKYWQNKHKHNYICPGETMVYKLQNIR